MPSFVNVVVVGVSGPDNVKGASGVGKSMLCNRFVRPSANDFIGEHCSVLSEIDFCGSPVINKDHWLYWGSRSLNTAENSSVVVKVVEQTEFLSDETYDTIAKSANTENYIQRCARTTLRSPDKLMYIQKEQLGSENEFTQELFPDGLFTVDGFVIVWDVSRDEPAHHAFMKNIINAISKTKKPSIIAFTKSDEMLEASKAKFLSMVAASKNFKNMLFPPIETCSLKNVNVEFVFRSLVSLCTRSFKNFDKPLSYREEARRVEQQNIHIKYSFTLLLSQTVPLHEWPRRYSNWEHVLVDLDRHPDLINFVTVFGSQVANEMYEKYATEAKNFNTINRLRALVPRLLQVFEEFEEFSGITDMDWLMAKEFMMSHDYFSTYFYSPEHGSPGCSTHLKESKLPAEVLLLPEAHSIFDEFKASKINFRYWKKLTEELEELFDQESHIYPGSEIEEVLPYIEGFCLDKRIPINLVVEVYENHQKKLIKKTRNAIMECAMEFLPALACRWTDCSYNDDLLINQYLSDNMQFHNMKKLDPLKNQIIKDSLMFLNEPSHITCPSHSNCLDLVMNQIIRGNIQLDISSESSLQTHTIQMYAFCGDKRLFDPFIVAIENAFEQFQEYGSPVDGILSSTIVFDSGIFQFEINIRSYHSEWLFTIEETPGTLIFTYDGRRKASFEHAQAAVEKLCMTSEIGSQLIVLVALVCEDDTHLEFVIEGAELSKVVGARFVVLNVDNSRTLEKRVMDLFNIVCEDASEQCKRTTSPTIIERKTSERPTVLMPSFSKLEVPSRAAEIETSSTDTGMDFSGDQKCLRVNFTDSVVMSKFYQPVLEPAPLATPETVDFSPIYSTVDDLFKPVRVSKKDNVPTSQSHTISPPVLCTEYPSQVSRRTSRLSLSTDSINRLHRTSNLIVNPILTADRKFTSSDSLCDKAAIHKEQKPQNRFVRKVASSFRLKKNFLGFEPEESTDKKSKHVVENNLLPVENHASRSLPQSPRTDRKSKIYTSINNTTGKVSNVLSWLPSKSSKILFKNKSATYDLSASVSSFTTVATSTRGVILPNQNLRVLCAASNTRIPTYLMKCIEFIEQNGGYEQEGLYRIPGNQTHLIELESNFLTTGRFEALHFDCPIHVAATALKNFFSCLPEALISPEFHSSFKTILGAEKKEEQINTVTGIISSMPTANQNVLMYLILHLGRVARSARTIMNAHNLSKVWTPTLFRPSFESYEELASGIMAFQLNLEFLINNSSAIHLKEPKDNL